jgi:hypothetical protein
MWKSADRALSLRVLLWHLLYSWGKKHGKTLVRLRKISIIVQYTYYQNTHTLQNPHKHTHYKTHTHTHTHITKPTHTHTHVTKQYKTITVQIKTNTVQDIPKWNSHNIIKYQQYKDTLMYLAPMWGIVSATRLFIRCSVKYFKLLVQASWWWTIICSKHFEDNLT